MITFEFAALDLADPDGVRYAYRLQGLDKDWIETDASRRVATYTYLPRPRTTLRAQRKARRSPSMCCRTTATRTGPSNRAGGFDTVSAYNAVKATTLAVLGLMLDDTARVRKGPRRSDVSKLSAERFPHVHAVARVADDADTFSYLIDVLIDGFSASLRSRRSA